jgi:E3 ubiquitin-protein ligase SHPRH
LTHADLVILLEPFLSPGDEAQAANRAHRIGQTRPVRCVTYFVRGTVEERLLAFRARQREFGGDEGDRSVGATRGGGEDSGVEESRACELGVIREGGADAFVGGTSRATRERVRFVFGIDDGDGATEAEAGVAEDDANGDADEEIADAGADAAEST